ncbi:hypothetical protein KI387_003275, partial [Taxus chinensis]
MLDEQEERLFLPSIEDIAPDSQLELEEDVVLQRKERTTKRGVQDRCTMEYTLQKSRSKGFKANNNNATLLSKLCATSTQLSSAYTSPEEEEEEEEDPDADLSYFRGLVLDLYYRPINIVCWRRAICMEFLEKADVLEYYDQTVSSPGGSFNIPAVLRLASFVHVPKRRHVRIQLSRKNIYGRDLFTCQYCGSKKDLTIDHILPVSRGGKWIWENLNDYGPQRKIKPLQYDPYTILRTAHEIAFVLDLPPYLGICAVFTAELLNPNTPPLHEHFTVQHPSDLDPTHQRPAEKNQFINITSTCTCHATHKCFQVVKARQYTDQDKWYTLQQLHAHSLRLATHTMESISFQGSVNNSSTFRS